LLKKLYFTIIDSLGIDDEFAIYVRFASMVRYAQQMEFLSEASERSIERRATMKKLVVLLLALTLVFASLGGAQAEEQTTLNLWHRWSGTNEAILNQCIEQFEAQNPGIKIEVTAKAGEYFELLQSMIADAAAGNPKPDVFVAATTCSTTSHSEMAPTPVEQLTETPPPLRRCTPTSRPKCSR
jgi:hypothetical protein